MSLLQKGKRIKSFSLFTFWFFLFTYLVAVPPLGISIAPAQAQKKSTALQRGLGLLKKGWINDAIVAFQQALKVEPQSLEAKVGLAIAYKRAGKLPEAWNAYQNVLAQDPNNQLALKSVGLFGTYRPEWQVQGIQALTTLLQLNPNDVEARSDRALLYTYQGRQKEAIADYQIVLENNPTAEAVLGAAQAFSYSGDSKRALELFNRYRSTGKAIAGFPAVAYASALRESGNASGAIQILEGQLQGSKTTDQLAIETRAELAKAYVANQQLPQALAVLDQLQGRPDAILPLARSLNEIRKITNNQSITQQVSSLYRQAIANNPNPSPTLLREAADVFSGLPGQKQVALELYRQAALKFPNDKGLAVRQLALENQLGLLSKADLKQRLNTVLQTLPTDKVELQQLGLALAEINSPDPELLPIYQAMLHSKVNNPGVNAPFLYFRVAEIYVQLNDLNGARLALAGYTATPQGAKDLSSQLLAAEIERREGNLEASAQRYLAVLNKKPDSNDITDAALRELAGVRRQQRRYDEALVIYDQLIIRNPQNLGVQLGRTSLAYQAKRISQQQAEAVLNNWLATQPATNAPPELYSLVGDLPADPQREALYNYLAQREPKYIPVQLRLVQAIAKRSPAQAKLRVKQLVANLPNSPNSLQIQGELASSIEDFKMASNAYETILAQQPDNLEALSALAGIRFQQKRFESAQQIYSEVLGYKPEDKDTRRAIAGLNNILDQPLAALSKLEQLQLEQMSQGSSDADISQQMQQIQEDFLLRRGFQPPWESYERRNNN
jgi:cellulose synthase operon protein C